MDRSVDETSAARIAHLAVTSCSVPDVLDRVKSEEGFANVAGVELTLLDCARYFHKAGGINAVAQVAKDIGDKADSAKLATIAAAYENSSVRRRGFLLDWTGHVRRARVLEPFAKKAKTATLLNPAAKPLVAPLAEISQKNSKWKLDSPHTSRHGAQKLRGPICGRWSKT